MLKNLRFTPAIQFVWHSLLSLFIGALVSGLTVIGQGVFATGADPRVILGAGLAAFSAWFMHGFISLSSNPQTSQAEADALKEVKDVLGNLLTSHQNLQSVVSGLVQSAQQPEPTPQPQAQFAQPFPYQASSTYPGIPTVHPGQSQ